MNFGSTLKRLRKSKNLRQKDLADYLHVSRPTIAGYETKNKQPDYEKLEQLALLFEVSVDYLITGINRPFPPSEADESFYGNSQLTSLVNHFEVLTDQSRDDLVKYAELLIFRDKQERERTRK